MKSNLFQLEVFGDSRGSLVAAEENKNIPFQIKRVYYIFNAQENIERGFHSHLNLEQVLICVNGHCSISLDDGEERKNFTLEDPSQGLYVCSNTWREMKNFSQDCVLLVLASEYFDPNDYIRDYKEFVRLAKRLKNDSPPK